MLQCEMYSNWFHCECVKVSPVIADNLPYICPFCIKSYRSLVSDLGLEISHLKARVIILEKSCSCKSQLLVSSLSVSSSSPLPISSTNLTTLPLSLPNTSNFHPPPSAIQFHFIVPLLPRPFHLLLLHPLSLSIPLLLLLLQPYPHPLPALHHYHLIIQLLLLLLPLLLLLSLLSLL